MRGTVECYGLSAERAQQIALDHRKKERSEEVAIQRARDPGIAQEMPGHREHKGRLPTFFFKAEVPLPNGFAIERACRST